MATLQRVNLAQLRAVLRGISKEINVVPVLKAVRLDVIAKTVETMAAGKSPDGTPFKPLKRPRPNSKGSDIPLHDKRILSASVTSPGAEGNIDKQDATRIEWGTNLDYSTIHQYGGVITPKVAKFLAIPVTTKAQAAGSPRNFPTGELKFRWGERGGVAFTTKGKGKRLSEIVQYYFTKSVTIPARPYLGLTTEQADEYAEWVVDHVMEQVGKNVSEA